MNMKRFLYLAVLTVIVLFEFNSCEDTTSVGIATYIGKVINEYTDEPLADIDVKVTNGDKIHSMTKTMDDGTFSIEVRLAEINDKYYILIGNNKVGTKHVDIPAFGVGEYNVGTITIKGPIETPVVETTLVRVDGKNLIFCEGTVVEVGEAAVTERGICYGTSTPTINNSKIECGDGKGGFSCQIEDIPDVHAKNYYVRAYATNKYGTSYGETLMIDHRNPYNLPVVQDGNIKYIVFPNDLQNGNMGGYGYSEDEAYYKNPNSNDNTASISCADLDAYDYRDWELPSRSVLEIIYEHKNEIGGFTNQPYWTSTYAGKFYFRDNYPYGSLYYYNYYYVDFESGTTRATNNQSFGVRPVRQY